MTAIYNLPNHDHRDMSEREFHLLLDTTHSALQTLKDICNANPPHSQDEIVEMALESLNHAYERGIRLPGEEDA